jgi:hypothetical protein
VEGILTPLSLLMPAFSLPRPPQLAYAAASLALGTLSYRAIGPKASRTRSFGGLLEPRYIVRARTLDQ